MVRMTGNNLGMSPPVMVLFEANFFRIFPSSLSTLAFSCSLFWQFLMSAMKTCDEKTSKIWHYRLMAAEVLCTPSRPALTCRPRMLTSLAILAFCPRALPLSRCAAQVRLLICGISRPIPEASCAPCPTEEYRRKIC